MFCDFCSDCLGLENLAPTTLLGQQQTCNQNPVIAMFRPGAQNVTPARAGGKSVFLAGRRICKRKLPCNLAEPLEYILIEAPVQFGQLGAQHTPE